MNDGSDRTLLQMRDDAMGREEDEERSSYHYERDAQFYFRQTGGEWNVYSCLYWPDENATVTEAQEAKLDILARMMKLKPGMRILDVGCGWGGPLTYLCQKYDVTGVGITVSSKQRDAAEARAKKYGVDARFYLTHWEAFTDEEKFDALYSDEVIVHFHELSRFFEYCRTLLKPGGLMVHKELHWNHNRYMEFGRLGDHIYRIFGGAGRYRLLGEELVMLNDNDFELMELFHIPLEHYRRTVDMWLKNMFDHRDEMKEIAGEDFYRDYRKYLKLVRWLMKTNTYSLDIVASKMIDSDEKPWAVD